MNKILLCAVSLVLICMVFLTGCAGTTSTTETEPTETVVHITTAAVETTTAVPTTTSAAVILKESYTPYTAFDAEGNEVSLFDIYGTGYTTYGGSLTFKEDMTFTLTIGIDKGDGVGTYKIISDEEVELSYKNGKVAIAKILETSDSVATEISVLRGDFNIIFN